MSSLKNSEPSNSNQSAACATAESCEAESVRYVKPVYRINNAESGYEVSIDLPGVNKAGLDITLEDGVLGIVGQRAWNRPDGWNLVRGIGQIAYSLKLELSDEVDTGKIEAKIENGVLDLTLSKKEEKLPRKIAIA